MELGRGSSVLEVIAAFEKAKDIEIPFEFASRRVGDVTEAWADPATCEKVSRLGIKVWSEEMLKMHGVGKVKILTGISRDYSRYYNLEDLALGAVKF